MIAKGATTEEILAILKPEETQSFASRLPLVGDLPLVLRQAGITMSSGAFAAMPHRLLDALRADDVDNNEE